MSALRSRNCSVGLHIPAFGQSGRRVDGRLPGADANLSLALAATLACGYIGMRDKLSPTKPMEGYAYAITALRCASICWTPSRNSAL